MKIVGYFHMFPPEHNAGSETTVHAALRAMVRRGHQVHVLCDRSKDAPYTVDGINVVRPPDRDHWWIRGYAADADLIVTHLDLTSQAIQLALDTHKPLVHFVHNDAQLKYWRVNPDVKGTAELVVFNSHWVANKEEWRGESIVVHPVVEPEYYRCERGTKITLVNPTPGKGADTFYALSKMLPETEFLTVKGVYGEQIAPPNINPDLYPNVETMEHTPDIREVFRKTRILLMPSNYESYGRVAVEAACAGIPTIAHPTPGLMESLGAAGIFRDRDDYLAWRAEIERLLTDDLYYQRRSDASQALADSLQPEAEFDRLEKALIETAARWGESVEVIKMWVSDRFIWRMDDGSFRAVMDQRIPAGAVSLYAGKGAEIPEAEAIKHGWLEPERKPEPEEVKAESEPEETKAFESPQETKKRTRKKVA